MCREEGHGCGTRRAQTHALPAIATVLGPEYQLVLLAIKIALGPPVVLALFQSYYLLGGLFRSGRGWVILRPVLIELIAAMLCHEEPAFGIECHSFAVAYPGRISFGSGKCLACLFGVVTPGAAASLLFEAGFAAGRVGYSILLFARVRRRCEVNEKIAISID